MRSNEIVREKVYLYISDKKVDLDDSTFILFNYTMEDLNNPTIVKNSFSKQITLKGTPANNEIFGGLFKSDRKTIFGDGYTGVFFDPLRKTPFTIYNEMNDILEFGYVKIDSVNQSAKGYEYKVTLYGEKGRLLYDMTSDQDGNPLTLSALDYGMDLSFPLTKESIRDAWQALEDMDTESKWHYINFVPVNNGIPDGIVANKTYLQDDGDALVELSRNYTEWEIRDLRCQFQRPAIAVSGIFKGLERWLEKKGYILHLDPAFFNKSNPHYSRLWMTLPYHESKEGSDVVGNPSQIESGNISVMDGITTASRCTISGGEMISENGYVDLSGYDSSCYVNGNLALGFRHASMGYLSYFDASKGIYEGTLLGAALIIRDGNSTVLYQSEVLLWGALTPGGENNDERLNTILRELSSSQYRYVGNDMSRTAYIAWNKVNVFASENLNCSIRVCAVSSGNNMGNTIFPIYSQDRSEDGVAPSSVQQAIAVYNLGGSISLHIPLGADVGGVIRKEVLLSNTPSPSAFLTSYCKQYGLQIMVEQGKVSVVCRNTFYNPMNVIDVSGRIDSQTISIVPAVFAKRWHKLYIEQHASDLFEKYKNKYGVDYGSMRIDTGYQFNNDEEDFYSSSVFKAGIMMRDSGLAYYRFFSNQGKEINPALIQGYIKDDERIYIPYSQQVAINTNDKGYDSLSKLCGYTEDGAERKLVDMSNVLIFFLGNRDAGVEYSISDDYSTEENAWRVATRDDQYAIMTNRLPEFSRYYGLYSLDYGTPREVYDPTMNLSSDSSLYERYWKGFLSDQYDVDGKVMKCKVNLSGMQVGQELMRNFFFYDNAIWVLNRISNHSITTDDLTECEFVKVKDIKNYTDGQIL